jgi:hypothetical protein
VPDVARHVMDAASRLTAALATARTA